jgi:hypothetical protein
MFPFSLSGAKITKTDSLRGGWIGRAGYLWEKHMGGTPPYGRIGKALQPLGKKHAEDEILKLWDKWLWNMVRRGRAAFVNVEHFASRYMLIKKADGDLESRAADGVEGSPADERPKVETGKRVGRMEHVNGHRPQDDADRQAQRDRQAVARWTMENASRADSLMREIGLQVTADTGSGPGAEVLARAMYQRRVLKLIATIDRKANGLQIGPDAGTTETELRP